MADNTIANAIKFLKGEEKSLPATKTEGQVYFAYKNVGTAEKPSYTGAIYIDTPIGGTQNRVKMTANADIADKAFNDSAGLNIRETYLSSLGYTDDGKQTILIKGSGNNQTKIALPIASATKSGIVTTDAQSFGGTKTFTAINSTNLTITGPDGFNYSGIGSGTADAVRPVWFADNSGNGKPVVNTNFTYNPVTQTLSVVNLSGTADKANKDNAGNDIRSTYIKNITVNGTTLTFTKGGGATSSITLQDTNNKVTQTAIKSSDYTNWRTVLWGASNSATEGFAPTTVTDGTFTSDTLTFQPSSGTLKAKIFKGSLSGNANTATALTSSAGSSTQPVYFSGGKPVACTYTLSKSVPSNAVFTDTNTWRPLGTTGDTACAGNDSRLSNARPASDVYSWAKASSKPSYSWGEITGKPSTFTPSSHTHNYAGSSSAGGSANWANGATYAIKTVCNPTEDKTTSGLFMFQYNENTTICPDSAWWSVVRTQHPGYNNGYWQEMAYRFDSDIIKFRRNVNGSKSAWKTIAFTDSKVSSAGYADSAGSAGSVAWGNVSGRPSSFTPSSHEHSYVLDVNNGSHTTFAYSKAGMNYGDYIWLAAWNGNELRAVNKTQFATASHTHAISNIINLQSILDSKASNSNTIKGISANGYWGLATPASNSSDWIRTTSSGLLPYQSGTIRGGHSCLGTSSWYFSNAYITTVNTSNVNIGEPGDAAHNGYIELYGDSPFIDFHAGGTTTDYTARIIADKDRITFIFA